MKYKPEPIKKKAFDKPRTVTGVIKWEVQFEEDGGGYIFDSQDDAMMFCLLLEIRDLLRDTK